MYPQWDSSVPHTGRWACCRLVADRWPTMPTSLRFVGCLRDDVFVSALVIHVSGLVCLTIDSAHGKVFVVAFTTHVGEVAIVGVDRNRRACPPTMGEVSLVVLAAFDEPFAYEWPSRGPCQSFCSLRRVDDDQMCRSPSKGRIHAKEVKSH